MARTNVKGSMLDITVNPQTGTTYTVLATDRGKVVTFSNAASIAVTLPHATGAFGAGFSFWCQNIGVGAVTITPTTSTVNGAATLVLAPGQGSFIVSDATNYAAVADSQATRAGLGLATSDSPQFAGINLGDDDDTTMTRLAPGEVGVEGVALKKVGKETIGYPAAAMTARTTNGAASGTAELATNDVMLSTFDFDTTTEEGVGFWVPTPKSWNLGTVTFDLAWTAASGSGGVAFGLAGYSLSNDDAMDVAVSGQQVVSDTLITANDLHITAESSAITIGGTPAAGDWVYFELTREVANGSDTLGVDAKLIGIRLYFTSNASTDA